MAPLVFWLEIDVAKHASIEGQGIFPLIILWVLVRFLVRLRLSLLAGLFTF
jgi:hypothetical protein